MIEVLKVESKALAWYCKKCNSLVEKEETSEGETQCQECKVLFLRCPLCEVQYEKYRKELLPLNENKWQPTLYCPDCDYKSLIEAAFSKRCTNKVQIISDTKSFTHCSKCSETFQNVRSLREHIVICLTDKSYISDEELKSKILLMNYLKLTDTYSHVNARNETKRKDKSITTTLNNVQSILGANHYNTMKLIKRCCSSCMYETSNKGTISSSKCCKNCRTPLDYKCIKCGKQYKYYNSIIHHLEIQCSPGTKLLTMTKHVKNMQAFKNKNKSKVNGQNDNVPQSVSQNKKQQEKKTLLCKFCPYETQCKLNLVIHMRRDHLRDTRNRKKESADKNLLLNEDNSVSIKKYCTHCEKYVEKLQRKCTECKTPLTYRCNDCKTKFSTFSRIKKHLRVKCNSK